MMLIAMGFSIIGMLGLAVAIAGALVGILLLIAFIAEKISENKERKAEGGGGDG